MGDIIKVLDGIPDRLALQKTLYLLQKMGLDFGYRYKWYTLGPYSPNLANDMFEGLSINVLKASDDGYKEFRIGNTYEKLRMKIPAELTEDTEQIEKLKSILKDDLKKSNMLECIASLLFLSMDRWPAIESKDDAFDELDKLKPGKFKKSDKKKAWKYLQDLSII